MAELRKCLGTIRPILIGLYRLSTLLHNEQKSHFNLLFYNMRKLMPFFQRFNIKAYTFKNV